MASKLKNNPLKAAVHESFVEFDEYKLRAAVRGNFIN